MNSRLSSSLFNPLWLLLGVYPAIFGFMLIYQSSIKVRPFVFSGQGLILYVFLAAFVRMIIEVRRNPRAKAEGLAAYLKAFAKDLSHGGFFIVLAVFAGVASYMAWRTMSA